MRLAFDCLDLTPDDVRRRFLWARRQGNPAWLWPEVSAEAWRTALGQIENVTRGALSAGGPSMILEGDPAAIGLAGYTSGMGPLLGWWLEKEVLRATPDIAAMLDLHLRHNRVRAKRMETTATGVVKVLHERNIAVVVLKGAHTASAYFPEPGTRPASDIDLLVHQGNADAAESVMRSLGFEPGASGPFESSWRPSSVPPEPRSLRLVHADDPWSIDLHKSLNLFVSAGAPLARLDALNPMASQVPWRPLPSAAALDQPALLMHLAVHAGAGLHSLTLLRLVELCLVIRQDIAANRLSWDDFLEAGRRADTLGYAYPALNLCEVLAPGTVPIAVLNQCRQFAPKGLLAVMGRLTPATAQRVDRGSVAEHFMWAPNWLAKVRQLAADMVPGTSWRGFWSIYERRVWQIINRRFSR